MSHLEVPDNQIDIQSVMVSDNESLDVPKININQPPESETQIFNEENELEEEILSGEEEDHSSRRLSYSKPRNHANSLFIKMEAVKILKELKGVGVLGEKQDGTEEVDFSVPRKGSLPPLKRISTKMVMKEGNIVSERHRIDLKQYAIPKGEMSRAKKVAKKVQKLKHPSINRIINYFEGDSDCLCVSTDSPKGGNIEEAIRCRRQIYNAWNEADIISIFYNLALGIKCTHDSNLFHGELSTYNIYFEQRSGVGGVGKTKICNFAFQAITEHFINNRMGGTLGNINMNYLSECYRNDVASLGVVIKQMMGLDPTVLPKSTNMQKPVYVQSPPPSAIYSREFKNIVSDTIMNTPDINYVLYQLIDLTSNSSTLLKKEEQIETPRASEIGNKNINQGIYRKSSQKCLYSYLLLIGIIIIAINGIITISILKNNRKEKREWREESIESIERETKIIRDLYSLSNSHHNKHQTNTRYKISEIERENKELEKEISPLNATYNTLSTTANIKESEWNTLKSENSELQEEKENVERIRNSLISKMDEISSKYISSYIDSGAGNVINLNSELATSFTLPTPGPPLKLRYLRNEYLGVSTSTPKGMRIFDLFTRSNVFDITYPSTPRAFTRYGEGGLVVGEGTKIHFFDSIRTASESILIDNTDVVQFTAFGYIGKYDLTLACYQNSYTMYDREGDFMQGGGYSSFPYNTLEEIDYKSLLSTDEYGPGELYTSGSFLSMSFYSNPNLIISEGAVPLRSGSGAFVNFGKVETTTPGVFLPFAEVWDRYAHNPHLIQNFTSLVGSSVTVLTCAMEYESRILKFCTDVAEVVLWDLNLDPALPAAVSFTPVASVIHYGIIINMKFSH